MGPEVPLPVHALGLDSELIDRLRCLSTSDSIDIVECTDMALLPRGAFVLSRVDLLALVAYARPARIIAVGSPHAWPQIEASNVVDYSQGTDPHELLWRIKHSLLVRVIIFSWGRVTTHPRLLINGLVPDFSPAEERIFRVLLKLWPRYPWVAPSVLDPPQGTRKYGSRVLSVHMRQIRVAIAALLDSNTPVIRTSRGQGYGFVP